MKRPPSSPARPAVSPEDAPPSVRPTAFRRPALRKKPMSQDVEDGLRKIYAEHEGEIPDLAVLERDTSSRLTRFLFRLILGLLGLAVLVGIGFFLWNPYTVQTSRPLSFAIEGPTSVISGEEVRYRVAYENRSRVPLAALAVRFHLPRGFVLTDTVPPPSGEDEWILGSLAPQSDGVIEIAGVFRSAVPGSEKLQAFFAYRPANFSSDFEEVVGLTVDVPRSVLEVRMEGPDKAIPGDEVVYLVHVKNGGSRPIERVRLRPQLPEAFQFAKSDPAMNTDEPAAWDIPTLVPGEEFKLSITGTFASDAAGTLAMQAEAGLLDAGGAFLLQAEVAVQTDIVGGSLATYLIVNGSDKAQTADMGERLRVSVDYANQGSEAVEGVSLVLRLETPSRSLPIDWNEADLGKARRQGNELVWDAANVPVLARLAPSDSGVIDLTLPLLETASPATVSDAFSLTLATSLKKVGSVATDRTVESVPLTVTLNSDARFAAAARYFDGEGNQLGSGSLPPKVGETTAYRLFWTLANTLHDLEKVVVTTNLPPGVAWRNKTHTDIGTLSYNETTRLLTWTVDKLPTELAAVEAWFELAVTPDADDVGSFLKLTNATSFEVVDATTRDTLQRSVDAIDTELPTDEFATGKGVVQK
ncbi:DUF11 domain-containing protein [Candidatus Uhrbacteria bacterium]|nr:DUF11 domain-containing protein [Candidatus Uhrbacteria bacterium]